MDDRGKLKKYCCQKKKSVIPMGWLNYCSPHKTGMKEDGHGMRPAFLEKITQYFDITSMHEFPFWRRFSVGARSGYQKICE
jgi:hypothetical protein